MRRLLWRVCVTGSFELGQRCTAEGNGLRPETDQLLFLNETRLCVELAAAFSVNSR